MTHPRRFRFAVDLARPFEGRSWLDTFREAEDLGYSTLFVPDHFDEGPGPIAAAAIGSPGQIAERLEARRDRWGYSYHVIPGDEAHAFAPIVADLTGR